MKNNFIDQNSDRTEELPELEIPLAISYGFTFVILLFSFGLFFVLYRKIQALRKQRNQSDMREITKEVYLEKQLKEKEELMLLQSKNAAMGEMISMIAHQWRQPITTISMNANNIIADIELETFNEEQIKSIAEDISAQTQFLSNTIDDFRNFFKTDKEVNDFKVKELCYFFLNIKSNACLYLFS